MLLIDEKLRDAILELLTNNPSPNVPVGLVMQAVGALQNLKEVEHAQNPTERADEGQDKAGKGKVPNAKRNGRVRQKGA